MGSSLISVIIMEPIILASSSPRRQEILKLLGIPYQVIMPSIDETLVPSVEIEDIPEFLAREKVSAVARSLPAAREIQWVLGADTIVTLDGKIYGKPKDQDEAASFLKALSARAHEVRTAMALYNGRERAVVSKDCVTTVTFKEMDEREIEWYVETGEWHGAAGGYRIQGLASCFITNIKGSYSSVMGLPISELYDMLKEQGYSLVE